MPKIWIPNPYKQEENEKDENTYLVLRFDGDFVGVGKLKTKTLLNYLPVPGSYEPCIELSEVNGKAWAL